MLERFKKYIADNAATIAAGGMLFSSTNSLRFYMDMLEK
jgi:hypothetical protein